MRVPVAWLKAYCDPALGTNAIAHALAMSGTEVERITRVGVPSADSNGALFRIGRVTEVRAHPDADRLSVCRVQLPPPGHRPAPEGPT